MQNIGSKIRAIRMGRGMTQEEVAKKLNMAANTYCKLETAPQRKWDDELIAKIAETLGVTTNDILSPTPIVMNFHNSPNHYGNYGHIESQTITISKEVLEIPQKQLEVKDELIKNLLEKLSHFSK